MLVCSLYKACSKILADLFILVLKRLIKYCQFSGTFGTMGVGPGFAIAAAFYCQQHAPHKRVLCVEGDSAFGFSGMEIETMFRFVFFCA